MLKDTPFTASSGERTIALSGDLDLAVREELRQQFEAAGDAANVIVDLTEVTYMDSSAIGALVRLHRDVNERNGTLVIRLRKNAAYRLLEIAGLVGMLTLEVVP